MPLLAYHPACCLSVTMYDTSIRGNNLYMNHVQITSNPASCTQHIHIPRSKPQNPL